MTEHDNQVAVVSWAHYNDERYPALKLLFAVPNAGKRSIGAARFYLAEGLKSGVPDLWLPVPHEEDFVWNEYCGLVIEMKFGNNKTTENQDWWLQNLASVGWKTAVHYSAESAIEELKRYLGIEE